MFFWNAYPFIRFAIALIVGIIIHDAELLPDFNPTFLLITASLAFALSTVISKLIGFYRLNLINGVLGLLFFVGLGFFVADSKYGNIPTNHYNNFKGYINGFSGTVISDPSDRPNYYRYEFELDNFLSKDSVKETSGKIFLYIKKDSTINSDAFQYGDQLLVKGNFFEISPPGNPHEFNYKQYLERQEIYAQAFITSDQIKKIGKKQLNPLISTSLKIRAYAVSVIDMYILKSRENGIAKALFLGIKDHLDNEIKESYAAAGAMHVLAVSGLHVGIIYMILKLLMGGLRSQAKIGKILFVIISVASIWLYAMITGLSPSVLRAATMFSAVAIGDISNREGNIYNTLGIAAFVLLLYDPYLIYSVGFQLSFAAVFGIVYLQPKLYALLDFKFKLLDQAWAITCVSIAAQLATFPLSAHYFHQFPTYFFLSNLVVIPAAFVFLVSGILMISIQLISPLVASFVGFLLAWIMWFVNEMISWILYLPNNLIEWIKIDETSVYLIYGFMISFLAAINLKSFKTLTFSALLLIVLIVKDSLSFQHQEGRNELIFYDVKNQFIVDHIFGNEVQTYIYNKEILDTTTLEFQINPNRLECGLKPIEESLKEATWIAKNPDEIIPTIIGDKKILIFDSTTFHFEFENYPKSDIIMIQNESVKSLKWMTTNFQTDLVLIGIGNSWRYRKKMKDKAKKLGVDIYSIPDDGAIKIEL